MSKKRIDSGQTNLFDLIEKIKTTAHFSPPSEGSLDIKNSFIGTIKGAIKQSSSSRWEIAGAMSAFVGTEITKFMLDSWTAESKDGHRFPAVLWRKTLPILSHSCDFETGFQGFKRIFR